MAIITKMQIFDYTNPCKKSVLALGAESAGNFSFFSHGRIFYSADFGDLLVENNFKIFKKDVLTFLKKMDFSPDIIITDLHPNMKTTLWGKRLCKRYKATHLQTQHHHAHLFSTIGEKILQNTKYQILNTNYGIAMDGTGYGQDGRIWGGEVFEISKSEIRNPKKIQNHKSSNGNADTKRIGYLENQIMIGGELAIQEPARILIAILNKFSIFNFQFSINSQIINFKNKKEFIYYFIKKHYTKKEFEVLYTQLGQNFNCIETSSAGRVLDAISLFLGFCKNKRGYKHEPIDLLEKNSTIPYKNLKPKIFLDAEGRYILNTTHLFNYVIKYLHKDKKRLAATAQLYLAEGLYEIIQKQHLRQTTNHLPSWHANKPQAIFASGGITKTNIISQYFASKNITMNGAIARGDDGVSFGQLMHFLLNYNA